MTYSTVNGTWIVECKRSYQNTIAIGSVISNITSKECADRCSTYSDAGSSQCILATFTNGPPTSCFLKSGWNTTSSGGTAYAARRTEGRTNNAACTVGATTGTTITTCTPDFLCQVTGTRGGTGTCYSCIAATSTCSANAQCCSAHCVNNVCLDTAGRTS